MKPIAININDEYKIKIETGNEFKGSIFEEVYYNASNILCDIIFQFKSNSEYDSYNNIIAFTGERGKGKSSSMISFRDAILNYDDKNKHASFFNSTEHEMIRLHNFAEIGIIDPSLFRGNESLFEIVVAKMFSKFQEIIKKERDNISDDERREIIKLFQQVFDNLKIINSDKKDIYNLDSLEALSNLAYSSNLRKCFGDLVDKYLNVIEDKNSFLIVSIDDFDLNISKAYEMLEDIRHFLIQKRIILLVACKIEQLKDSITNEIVKEYKYKLNLQQKNTVNASTSIDETMGGFNRNKKNYSSDFTISSDFILNEISNKSEKYIEKLIPFNHQIFIPGLTDFCDIEFFNNYQNKEFEFNFYEQNSSDQKKYKKDSLIYIGEIASLEGVDLGNLLEFKNEQLKIKLVKDKKLFLEKNIYDCLLKLIYSKSNIFINKTDFRYNSIFPSTLRELNELIKIFNNEDILDSFRKYILNKSINDLPDNLKKIILEIDKQDFSILNSHIVGHLEKLKDYFESSNLTVVTLKDTSRQLPLYTSIGDVISKFKLLYEGVKPINKDWYKFLDILSIYYDIRINQTLENKPKLILEYCKGGLFNGEYKVFPNTELFLSGARIYQRRDWINYKIERKPGQSINAIFKSLDEENAYWFAFFVQFFGIYDLRNKASNPYFRNINQSGGGVLNLTFSPFAILTNIMFPVDVWNSIFTEKFNNQNVIVQDIIKWKEENTKFQNLMLNSMFYIEFIDNLSIISTNAFRTGLPNYFQTLHWYFSEGIKNSLKYMNKKYSYLGISENVFDNHPIMLHWERIIKNEDIKNNMEKIFENILIENTGNNNEIDVLDNRKILKSEVSNILNQILNIVKNSPNITSRKITNKINIIPKEKDAEEIIKKLNSIKKGLNSKDKENVAKTKSEIIEYLNSVLNG